MPQINLIFLPTLRLLTLLIYSSFKASLLLAAGGWALFGVFVFGSSAAVAHVNSHPNILFITLDDMNWDSIGSYGCAVDGISPHIDRLAASGMRFQYAYNQSSNCVPSRNAYQTGRYPHTSGLVGFFNVKADFQTLPEVLKANGYATAVINKPADSSANAEYKRFWDYHVSLKGADKRSASMYADQLGKAYEKLGEGSKPFYFVLNVADPHKPFFNDEISVKKGFDKFEPSRVYGKEDVEIPPFLPEHPEVHQEILNYFNSVKRGDDCVGAVLDKLESLGLASNTVVILVSDHGMPFPFAKTSLYMNGLRTPLIIRWKGVINPGSVDSEHMISAVDFMPTILDVAGVSKPDGLQGKSYLPIIMGGKDVGRDRVYAELGDNSGGFTFPMRAVHTKQYNYVFNAWATGESKFQSASSYHVSEGVLKRLAKDDSILNERYQHLLYRSVEELYDIESDPHALNNLINDPAHQEVLEKMRKDLQNWMVDTDDPLIKAFQVKDEHEQLVQFMEIEEGLAMKRASEIQWKRGVNRMGNTKDNQLLFDPEN